MHKKCSVCEEATAQYLIKDTTDYYCEECALQCFGDLGLLVTVEEQAKKLKEMIDASLIDPEQQSKDDFQSDLDQESLSQEDTEVEQEEGKE